jgi:hypothetical protein
MRTEASRSCSRWSVHGKPTVGDGEAVMTGDGKLPRMQVMRLGVSLPVTVELPPMVME